MIASLDPAARAEVLLLVDPALRNEISNLGN